MGKPARATAGTVGNTPSHSYAAVYYKNPDCHQNSGAVKKSCSPESEGNKKNRKTNSKNPLIKYLKPKANSALPNSTSNPKSRWIGDHCEFLMIKPSSPDEMAEQLQAIPQQMADQLQVSALEAVKEKASAALQKAVEDKIKKAAAKQLLVRGGSWLGGPWVGVAANIAMTADGANDLVNAAKDFPELTKTVEQATRQLDAAKSQIAEAQKDLDKYSEPKKYNKQALVSDMMHGLAELNPCIRARRCSLVPYKETELPAANNGGGCCPGQTGHHVLPGSMFKNCPDYKHSEAPTICVEGVNNTHGSHGHIHRKLGAKLGGLLQIDGKTKIPPGAQIMKKDAIDAGVDSVKEAFPESLCDEHCLKAQLHEFYGRLNCVPRNESGESTKSKNGKI
jgi:hypothetical protein